MEDLNREALDATSAFEALAQEGSSDNPSREVFTVANLFTFMRIILTLLFLWFFGADDNRTLGVVLFIIAASSDFFDGTVARATNSVSWLGKVLDPIVDRLLLVCGVLGLYVRGELPLWVAVFVIGRDLILAVGLHFLHKYQSRPLDVLFIGKVATALLLTGFSLMLIGSPIIGGLGLVDVSWLPGLNAQPAPLGLFFVYVGCVFSLITMIAYLRQGISIITKARRTTAESPEHVR